MKQFAFVVLLIGSCAVGSAAAADTNWLQTGIRSWYLGVTQPVPPENEAPKPPTPAALAYLIRDLQADVVNMAQYSWSPSMVATSWLGFTSGTACALSRDEGPFWALPSRLQPLQTGAEMTWRGKKRTVTERNQYTPDKLPVALLPTRALFQLTGQRDLLWLQFKTNEQNLVEDTLFDVETGLVLYHSAIDAKTKTCLCLAELNYDFAAQRGFAEDAGLHTSYAGTFAASTIGAGGIQFNSQVKTRYKDEVVVNIISVLASSGLETSSKDHLLYFNGRGEARIVETSLVPPPLEQWQPCGDHNFWWVPPADLTSSQITAWATPLYRAGVINNRTTFSTRETPPDPGLRSLTFDSRGFLSDLAVLNRTFSINLDTAGLCFNRRIDIAGPADYASMAPAAPVGGPAAGPAVCGTNAVRLVFGQLLQAGSGKPEPSDRNRPKTTATGLDGLRAEYETVRANMEQTGRQRVDKSASIAERISQGRVLREQLRQLDKHYMDVLDRMQKEAGSASVHNAVESEKLRVWRTMDGLDRQM